MLSTARAFNWAHNWHAEQRTTAQEACRLPTWHRAARQQGRRSQRRQRVLRAKVKRYHCRDAAAAAAAA